MSIRVSDRPVSEATSLRVSKALDDIKAVYRYLYPAEALRFLLNQSEAATWAAPHVFHEHENIGAQHLSASYLGSVTLPAEREGAREMTVGLSIPRAPTVAELRSSDAAWRPPRRLAPVFKLMPGLYEWIRYQIEMRRKRLSRTRHVHKSLPMSPGTPLIAKPGPSEAADKRPAVLIGFHWLEVGGAEKLAFDCVRWALEAGLRVIVVAAVPSLQRLADRLPDHPDVTLLRTDQYLPHHLWPRFVQNLVLKENVRLVHIHHCEPLYQSLPQLRVAAPWVKVIDSTHIIEYANGGYPRISGVWANFIDMHHVISQQLFDYYRDVFNTSHNVRLGRMIAQREGEFTLPALNFKFGQKKLRVAFIGRLYYQKRPIVLMQSVKALAGWARRNGVELEGTIVGDGPFQGAVQALLRSYGLSDRIQTKAADANVPELLKNSDILLLPSNNEGLALVCYEAIEHGCIPISTDVGSQYEIVPPDLLVPLSPGKTVRSTVAIVDQLWKDGAFLARQQEALHKAWKTLAADPSDKDVVMPVYQAVARGTEVLSR